MKLIHAIVLCWCGVAAVVGGMMFLLSLAATPYGDSGPPCWALVSLVAVGVGATRFDKLNGE